MVYSLFRSLSQEDKTNSTMQHLSERNTVCMNIIVETRDVLLFNVMMIFSLDHYKAHLLGVHWKKRLKVSCKHCTQKFTDFDSFLTHMRGHQNTLRPELYSATPPAENATEEVIVDDNIPIVDLENDDIPISATAPRQSEGLEKAVNMLDYQKEFIIKECVEHRIPPTVLAKKWGCTVASVKTWVQEAGFQIPDTSRMKTQAESVQPQFNHQPTSEMSPGGKPEQQKNDIPAAKLNIKINNPSELFPIPPPLPLSNDLFSPSPPPPPCPSPPPSLPVVDTPRSSSIPASNCDTPASDIPMFGKSLSLLKHRTKDSNSKEDKWSIMTTKKTQL